MNNTVENVYGSAEYKRSQKAYTIECAFEYFIALVVTDAFLAKLLRSMGADDALCGIISSFISLAMLFQLCSLFVVGRITNTKKTAVAVHTAAQLLFTALYLIPFLPFPDAYKRPVFVICMLAAYFGNYLVTSVIFKWGMSFVDPARRARYASVKEMVSLASGVIVSLLIGIATDAFDSHGNTKAGFAFTAACMAIFSICDFVCLMLIKNEPVKEKTARQPLIPALRYIFTDKRFLRVLLIHCLFNIATYATIGFMGTYKQDELAYTIGQIQIINTVGVAGRFFASRPFGRFSDKHSYYKGIMLALVILSVAFLVNMFTAPGLRWLVIAFTLLQSVSCAGTSQNLLNITYAYVPEKYFVHATVIKSSVSGVVGFCATLVSGRILSAVQSNGNTFLGMHVYSQQLLSAISLAVTLITLVYMAVSSRKMKTQ